MVIIILLLTVFWSFFIPGPRSASDFPYSYLDAIKLGFNIPFAWSERWSSGLGNYMVSTLWSWLIDFIYGLMAVLHIDFSISERIIGILLPILIGFWGLNKLLKYLEINKPFRYLGIFFFLTNTYFLLLIDGGQLSLALAYAILPACFILYREAIETETLFNKTKFAISTLLLSIFDLRIVYFLLLLISLDFIFEVFGSQKKIIKLSLSYAKLGLFLAIILIGYHAYWIFPAILSENPGLPVTYTRTDQISFLSFATIGHTLSLLSPNWFVNIFGKVTNLQVGFLAIPILVFTAFILRKKDKWLSYWGIIAIVAVFLAKGSNLPFPSVYSWLFINIPGFSLFRDPLKFAFLICLSYSILISVSIQELNKVLTKKILLISKYPLILTLVSLSYLFLLINPTYLGGMTGLFAIPPFQQEQASLNKVLISDKSFGRVLWIPRKSSLGYSNQLHPVVEIVDLLDKRPFAIGAVGTYEQFNFLREAPYMGEILDVAGISYIAYPPLDPKRDNIKPDNIKYYNTFLNQIRNLPWISKQVKESQIPLLKTKESQPKFFITQNIWWVIGSDSIYNEATKSAKLQLAHNSLIFADESLGLGKKLQQLPQAKVILNDKTLVDLAASFIDEKAFMFPAKILDFQPNKSGWWKRETADLISWRDFLQSKYQLDSKDFDLGGGWAVAEGDLNLTINSSLSQKGDILLARVLESSKSGELSFSQTGSLISKVETQKNKTNFRWIEVGTIKENKEPLIITSHGDINVVNALAFVTPEQWNQYKLEADNLQKQGRIVDFNDKNIEENTTKVSFREINSTKYIVNVTNVNKPTFLVFSEYYDSLWKINNQKSFPVYSLLNGFSINKNGEYTVEFSAQKYVYYGLIVTMITLVLLLLLIFLSSKRNKSNNN